MLHKLKKIFRSGDQHDIVLHDKLLTEAIANRRVLILGSGPSAKDLSCIPEDVVVMTCNAGPKVLSEQNLPKVVDIYIGNQVSFENYDGKLDEILKHVRINLFLTRNKEYIEQKDYRECIQHILLERMTKEISLLKQLVYPTTISVLLGGKRNSTGIALLQYALFYKAKEIYLAGIDLSIDTHGHAYISPNEKRYEGPHKEADHNFVHWAHKTFNNIYVTSQESPLVVVFPYKKLL